MRLEREARDPEEIIIHRLTKISATSMRSEAQMSNKGFTVTAVAQTTAQLGKRAVGEYSRHKQMFNVISSNKKSGYI